MGELYLRKEKSLWQTEKKLKRVFKSTKLKIILFVSILGFSYTFIFSSDSYLKIWSLEDKKEYLQRTYLEEEVQQKKISDSINALKNNDKFTIEKKAREKFSMTKQNETLYKILPKK